MFSWPGLRGPPARSGHRLRLVGSRVDLAYLKRYPSWWRHDPSLMAMVHALIGFGAYVVWRFIFHINDCYYLSEYVLKFDPFLLGARPIDWFDTWAMGDPRPRLVTVMGTLADLKLRGIWSRWAELPPALGINWLAYPLTGLLFYRATVRMTGQRTIALAALFLWGLSPAALDSLVACYVPAKSLMNLWFAWALYLGVALAAAPLPPGGHLPLPAIPRATWWLAIVTLLALLTDESAAVIIGTLPVIFWFAGKPGPQRQRTARLMGVAFGIALGAFAFLALGLYPTINHFAGQVPLDYVDLLLKGPSTAYLGNVGPTSLSSKHLGEWSKNFQPLGTAFTIFTAYLVPFRRVTTLWTAGVPLTPDLWPRGELAWTLLVCGLFIDAARCVPTALRRWVAALAAAGGAMIIIYAALVVPLAPAIVEVNYYASLSAFFFAMLGALVFGDLGRTSLRRLLSVGAVVSLGWLELAGYNQTAKRNRIAFSNPVDFTRTAKEVPWDYSVLRHISSEIAHHHFTEVIHEFPYPSRAFCYAFELEASREHAQDRAIDFSPFEDDRSLYGELLMAHLAWLQRRGMLGPESTPKASWTTALAQGAQEVSGPELVKLTSHQSWAGEGPGYVFLRTFTGATFVERYWIPGIMRVWQQQGGVSINGASTLTLHGSLYGTAGMRILKDQSGYAAFLRNGHFAFRFRTVGPVAP